ncbi:MAG: zf-HC2 domain-containing protein, partial [Acidobacteria bacterium]|nr:zf-HC2 domain-containing protein [Acidobacteriota bacterium]
MNAMTCEQARENGLAATYVAGVMTDGEMDSFEAHYFACDACFAEVEAMRYARAALQRPRRKAPTLPRWGWIIGVAAATIVGVWLLRPPPVAAPPAIARVDRTAQLISLAKFERPAYSPLLQRGVDDGAFA